jgi:hypothetical protein
LKVAVRPWAEVLIDDRSVGTTPLAKAVELGSGIHRITLRNPYFPAMTRIVDLQDSACSLSFDLNHEFALVDIRVSPWAVLEIDHRFIDTTPLSRPVPLTLGEHTVTLRHPKLGVKDEHIRLDSLKSYRFAYDMARK